MSVLLGAHSLSKSFGTQSLFEDLSFTLHKGDKIGLIGPNGSGKTTLLKILAGIEPAGGGEVTKRQGLRIGYASQVPVFPSKSLEEVLTEEVSNGDEIEILTRARILLSKAEFTDFTVNAATLSGGWKKRLDIARALMPEPDLLLLDEPTNHLDLEGILWLETLLNRERVSFVVISHDRYFLENAAERVIEINKCYPEGLFISDGGMSDFMVHREAFLKAQQQRQKGLASVLREETEWLKRSPKARTTKSRSRVKNAYQMMEELSDLKNRNKTTRADIHFAATERETRRLIITNNLTKSLGGKPLFKGIDLLLSPGSRVGIVGKNGTGKTTLLKILAGMVQQDQGTVKYAEDVRLVYFDQHREQIPMDTTLKEALSPGSDYVNYRGKSIHVNGWAQKFLFPSERLNMPVGLLSGGERARILIARLMLKPADILFLDEPTNDLDIQTLEVIESSLMDFPGALVLITHDRCMMDRLCTQILGLGEQNEEHLFADYDQWQAASADKTAAKKEAERNSSQKKPVPNKLTYKEKREFEGIEHQIVSIEKKIKSLHEQLEDPLNKKSPDLYSKLASLENQLEVLFNRWEELSGKA